MESPTNPAWEAASALICVAALVAIVAIVQMWPAPAISAPMSPNSTIDDLAEKWARAPVLNRITQSKSFKQATHDHQALIIRGWLDKSSPKRFQSLSSPLKDQAVTRTIVLLEGRFEHGLQADASH
ncbi:MAG: hypothetical protein H7Y17_06335 [Chlorobia bacterium]|nr:hypothetical protein [Fimbriimonadaceae bacterium]